MSDYTQSTDFSSKDLLPRGHPNKIIKGSEFDSEFDAIATAIASKYDSSDLATEAQAQAESSNAVLMTPLRVANWADANAGIVGDLQALADPNADRLLFWDDSAGAAAFLSVGPNLSLSGTTLDVGDNVPLKDAANEFSGANTFNTLTASGASIAALTVTGSITLPARSVADSALSDNVVRKNANNTFRVAGVNQQSFVAETGTSRFVALRMSVDSGATFSYVGVDKDGTLLTGGADGDLVLRTPGKAIVFSTNNGASAQLKVASDGTITLNGVNVTDYARKPQENTFLGTTQTVSAANANWRATNGTVGVKLQALSVDVPELGFVSNTGLVGTETNHELHFLTNNRSRGSVRTDGSFHLPIVATSTSTTLAAGQVHAITSNAALPNMVAGQWVTVINNGNTPITVTKNASNNMYWTASGASVTSVTIPARGRASFVCADGTNVYASGNITGSS